MMTTDDSLKWQVSRWLRAPNIASTHNLLMKHHTDGTGEWFLNSDAFVYWMSTPGANLWVRGIPGNGKTFLGAAIINRLQRDPQIPVLYWYFTFRDGPTQHCDNFVRSLLTQLLWCYETIPAALGALFQHHTAALTRPSLEELTTCLVSILNTLPAVRLVSEGFDECLEWSDLSKIVSTLLSGHCPTLRFIFTSRTEGHVADVLNTWNLPSVDMRRPEMVEDVRKHLNYVVHTDPRFTRISADGKNLIWQALGDASEGCFIWAVLHLTKLHKARTMNTLRASINTLPRTLDESYALFLSNMDEAEHPHIRRMLSWLCVARRRLTLDEIQQIYHMAAFIKPPFSMDDVLFHPEDLVNMCYGLFSLINMDVGDGRGEIESLWEPLLQKANAMVRASPKGAAHYTLHQEVDPKILRILQLAHYTLKEYLTHPSKKAGEWYMSEEECHLTTVKHAIASFLQGGSVKDIQSLLPVEIALTQYCVAHLEGHLRLLKPREHPELEMSFQYLLEPPQQRNEEDGTEYLDFDLLKQKLYPWFLFELRYGTPAPYYGAFPPSFLGLNLQTVSYSPSILLSLGARLGLKETLKYLVATYNLQPYLNNRSNELTCGPPIVEAALWGRADVVGALVEMGADVGMKGWDGRTAGDINRDEEAARRLRVVGGDEMEV